MGEMADIKAGGQGVFGSRAFDEAFDTDILSFDERFGVNRQGFLVKYANFSQI